MRLCCVCGSCGQKMIMTNNARTRSELAQQIGFDFNIKCGHCKNTTCGNVNIVFAESSYRNAPLPTIASGAGIGLFFGPGGLLIGLGIGVASGIKIKNSDKGSVHLFNNS